MTVCVCVCVCVCSSLASRVRTLVCNFVIIILTCPARALAYTRRAGEHCGATLTPPRVARARACAKRTRRRRGIYYGVARRVRKKRERENASLTLILIKSVMHIIRGSCFVTLCIRVYVCVCLGLGMVWIVFFFFFIVVVFRGQ